MPPKSAKKEKTVWWKCENCKLMFLTMDLTKHQANSCTNWESLSGYVTGENVFFSNHFEKQYPGGFEDLKDIHETQLNGLILFSNAVMRQLELALGDLVEVTVISGGSESGSFIRKVWPIDDKSGVRVYSRHIDELPLDEWTNLAVSIKPFMQFIPPIAELELSLCGKNDDEILRKNEQTFLQLLRRQYLGRILSETNLLQLKLCNKTFTFQQTNVKLKENTSADIVSKLENLTLGRKCFQFNRESKLCLKQSSAKSEDCQKQTFDLNRIGGLDEIINEIKEITKTALGLTKSAQSAPISRGILIYGVSGIGKTLLVNSIAEFFKSHIVRVNCTEIFSKFYGESEANISKLFSKALGNYPSPTIVIVEEIHNLCPKSEGADVVKRISQYFINLLDNVHSSVKGSRTLVIGTTDNVDNLNPSVRRSGRMDYEFELPVPNAEARKQILSKVLSSYDHALQSEEIDAIARITHGFVGADLVSLVGRAMHETTASINYTNMRTALQHVKASAMREIMIDSPNVHWSDIGGQDDLKLKLRQIIEWPIHRPEIFTRLGIAPPRGLLMFGPPGCSKTMIAKAIATESKVNFLSIKGSELFSMWVGESERAVRELFRKARQVAPSIIFFDEIDAIGGERSADSGSSVKERVLAQILTEIDGVSVLKNVKIIAATNRPDLIDKALMRPGRLDRIIYVRLPDDKTREEIFKIKLTKIPISSDVNVCDLVLRTDGYSGSEIEAVCQEAVLRALEESFDAFEISRKYFEYALQVVKPRTSAELLQLYECYLKQ